MVKNLILIIFLIFIVTIDTNLFAQQVGQVDTTIGYNGLVATSSFSYSNSHLLSAAVQQDNKLVAVGMCGHNQNGNFALVRYNVNGTLDTTFGGDGIVETQLGNKWAQAWSAAIQQDGKIIAGGVSSLGATIVRYLIDGNLDPSFDLDGIMSIQFSTNNLINPNFGEVLLQPDGKIIAIGSVNDSSLIETRALIARINTDGAVDTTFAHVGWLLSNSSLGQSSYETVALQNDGKIIVGGRSDSAAVIIRFNTDGTFDSLYNNNILNINQMGGLYKVIKDLAISNNKCYGLLADSYFLQTFKIDDSGNIDGTFGNNGFLTDSTFGPQVILLQPNGKLVEVGKIICSSTNDCFGFARYDSIGNIDSTFGTFGKTSKEINFQANLWAGVMQPNNYIVAAGSERSYPGANWNFCWTRVYTDFFSSTSEVSSFDNSIYIFPNPIVNSQFTISYSLESIDYITVKIYDLMGHCIQTIFENQKQEKGKHSVNLQINKDVVPGFYILTIATQTNLFSSKIIVQE